MIDSAKIKTAIAAAVLAATLAACATPGSTTDDKMGSFLVAPDKFMLFNCQQIAEKITATTARQRELEGLMAKAGPEAGGRLVSSIAYQPEYSELHGDMNELRGSAVAKNCKDVPAGAAPGGRASDRAVR